jgi:glycosidase/DNA/RNA endonuclease YhcR with UshA esterase domain
MQPFSLFVESCGLVQTTNTYNHETSLTLKKILSFWEEKSLNQKKGKWLSCFLIFTMVLQFFATASPTIEVEAAEQSSRVVTLVGDLQNELGASGDWDPTAEATQMKSVGNGFYQLTGELPAGKYEFKIAINKSWDENYGDSGANGGNLTIELSEPTMVTFYYHDGSHAIADTTWYTPISVDKQPRIAGNIQPAIKAGDEWSPATSTALLMDDNFDQVYTYTTDVPKGNYEYKIVLGKDWGEAYPSQNATLNVLNDSEVTFFYNHETKEVSTSYNPVGSDGSVTKSALHHDTWEKAYRQPFGAVKVGEEVTLRLAVKQDDITKADLYMKNNNTGTSKNISLQKAGVSNGKEYWEATFKPEAKGVYGYKFIVYDNTAKAEYGEDTVEGKTGGAVDSNAELFQLTVFDPGFKTPDWMKEAVVYQIFPDRFYNGNTTNDDAKENARGEQPIEQREWSELPDNPRLLGTAGYDGDGHWSNDFFGGDVKGIQAKLDYIESLGVNTIYLNPVAHAASNHKYDATDWKSMDPMFGTPEEFKEFTDELEKRGMHLILDGVFNHVGDDSIYFDRYGKFETVGAYEYWSRIYDLINEEGISEDEAKTKARTQLEAEGQVFNDEYGFHNWFNISNEIVSDSRESQSTNERYAYQAWWGYDSLPEIKSIPGEAVNYDSELNNKPFADYIMYNDDSVAKSWITNGGSGWRLDVANEVDMEFWREFRKELKVDDFAGSGATLQEGEQPLILGEIWDDASKYFLGDQYDSVMNYRFERAVKEDYPDEAYRALMNLMGSHDTPRAVYLLGNGTDSFERAEYDPNYDHELGVKRLKLASIIQMGYPGAPTIYYGDEAGVTGSKDPDDRRTYPWGSENTNLIAHYQKVGAVREAHSNLFAYGDIETLYADGDVYAFARMSEDGFGVVAINRGTSNQTVELDVKDLLKINRHLTDQLDFSYKVHSTNGKLTIDIPAMSGRMLVTDEGQDLAFPESVSNLQFVEGQNQVELSWTGTASKYKVYQSTIKGSLYEEVVTVDGESTIIEGLTNGQAYYFAVAAIDTEGNESIRTETTNPAIPHYKWTESAWIGNVTQLENEVLDLSKKYTIKGEVYLPGATDEGEAQGLIAKLQVKKTSATDWTELPAVYTGQSGNNNVFSTSFRPIEKGTYSYQYAFSTDRGVTWKTTDPLTVEFIQNDNDTKAPASSIKLEQPIQESGQVNLSWSLVDSDNPYLLVIERNGEQLQLLENASVTKFTDYEVENGTEYSYRVIALDESGNQTASNEVRVTPDIVMVEVTFKVHAPDYTPLNTKITMPGDQNGWNTGAWEMSRNGAVTTDWEVTREFPEGTQLTYKYVKNESWDQEGLADHTRNDKTDDDISFYGYGAEGTDLKVTVTNQGNNKMVVNDEIFRWIDQPLVITSPANNSTVESDKVTVKGNAIKEGILKINGELVPVGSDMSFTHTVKLNDGINEINLSIEPSEENKTKYYNNNGGAIGKSTKQSKLVINKALTIKTIEQARGEEQGKTVTIEGVITTKPDIFGEKGFYIQDDTAGAYIVSAEDYSLTVGDVVRVTGNTDDQKGEFRLVDTKIEKVGTKELPAAVGLNPNQVGEDVEGQLVSLNGVNITTLTEQENSFSFNAEKDGKLVGIFVDERTGLAFEQFIFEEGDLVNIQGVVGQSGDKYIVKPIDTNDVLFTDFNAKDDAVVVKPEVKDNKTTIHNKDVQLVPENGHLIVEIVESDLTLSLNPAQINRLKEKKAKVTILNEDLMVSLPLVNLPSHKEVRIKLKQEKAVEGAVSPVYSLTVVQDKKQLELFEEKVLVAFRVDSSQSNNLMFKNYDPKEKNWLMIGSVKQDGYVITKANKLNLFGVFK